MRKAFLLSVIAAFVICSQSIAGAQSRVPIAGELKLVAQLPAEFPQRISSIAYDGEKFWVGIYQGHGLYAILNPATLGWQRGEPERYFLLGKLSGSFESPGGICFVNGKLWVAGSYGDSFGSIDLQKWEIENVFRGKQREGPASQSYSAIAYDGSYLWVAWHWANYKLPDSETQLLLKVDPTTGKIVSEYAVPPGKQTDMTHGLAWDGRRLWHMKDSRLSAIDHVSGGVIAKYTLAQIKRPTGLAWDGEALWISEFDGKVWRLPFRAEQRAQR